jgi:hypothetical protein
VAEPRADHKLTLASRTGLCHFRSAARLTCRLQPRREHRGRSPKILLRAVNYISHTREALKDVTPLNASQRPKSIWSKCFQVSYLQIHKLSGSRLPRKNYSQTRVKMPELRWSSWVTVPSLWQIIGLKPGKTGRFRLFSDDKLGSPDLALDFDEPVVGVSSSVTLVKQV